ncbi:MAG: pyrroline-5-carboxylate reductase [Bdellovibrionota bacterium]
MRLVVIGGGNMGAAFAVAFENSGQVSKSDILVVETVEKRREFLSSEYGWSVQEKIDQKITEYDTVLLALKPQEFEEPCSQLKKFLAPNSLILSVMTGIKIVRLKEVLGVNKIIRCMPNTPVLVGQGVTAYLASPEVEKFELETVEQVLNSVGLAVSVSHSELIDSATSLSASGAGFVFYFAEHMLKAAIEMGFNTEDAENMVRETFSGAMKLWLESDKSIGELREQVTSKGGTTAAGFAVFEEAKLGEVSVKALKRAKDRAEELSV